MGCKVLDVTGKRSIRSALSAKLTEVKLSQVSVIGESTNEEA